jgi:Fe-Mn family superoxide dismutase
MFKLPELPYSIDALAPHISAQTLQYHHGKHHASYTAKLNDLLAEYPDLLAMDIHDLLRDFDSLVPDSIKGPVLKNAAQFENHNLYWISLSPNGGGEPANEIATAINARFGSYSSFQEKFSVAGTGQFGSGWVWLSIDDEGKLAIDSTSNEDTPLMHGKTPLMTMDVWEHAYYLDYQNRRPDYINAFFELVDWEGVNKRFIDQK